MVACKRQVGSKVETAQVYVLLNLYFRDDNI